MGQVTVHRDPSLVGKTHGIQKQAGSLLPKPVITDYLVNGLGKNLFVGKIFQEVMDYHCVLALLACLPEHHSKFFN